MKTGAKIHFKNVGVCEIVGKDETQTNIKKFIVIDPCDNSRYKKGDKDSFIWTSREGGVGEIKYNSNVTILK